MSEHQVQQMKELLQKSLIKINQLEQQLAQQTSVTPTKNQKTAIIGYAFRFPNNINNLQELWELLINKKDVVQKVPKSRFDIDALYDEDIYAKGKTNSTYGTFLQNDITLFDNDFFNIPPREAKSIDPIQRQLLEVTYEAFENAGISTQQLKGKNVGVFVAVGVNDYIQARLRSGNLEDIDVYDATGIPFATICGRISYSFDFTGQSIAVDTACSSVLTAIHQAQHALLNLEIDIAVIASANLLLAPELYVALSKLGSLSPCGKTKAFAEDADGYVRGEGIATLIIKREDDAVKNNDTIELLIRSSAIHHNGTSNGFTAPNPKIQIDTIKEALQKAQLSIHDIDLIEAHGIGNKYTDSLEIQAIANAYKGRTTPLYVGSVKSNIGHMEACTGMPMLFKLMASMQHQAIPPQIHINELSKDIAWDGSITKVSVDSIPWNKEKKFAAINLSGYSGTNVHTIFESANAKTQSETIEAPYIFNLSAKTKKSLLQLVQKYIDDAQLWQSYTLTELCYTLSQRNVFDYRLSILINTKDELLIALKDIIANQPNKKVFISEQAIENKHIVFQFTGQGAQYFGMGKELYQHFEVFSATIDECATILSKYLPNSIKDILWGTPEAHQLIHQTKYTQPALFVFEYAMAKLLIQFGIQPTVLVGHSIGELVALCLADVLSLNDALFVVLQRANLMQQVPNHNGAMAAVFCDATTIEQLNTDNSIEIAGFNTPHNTTITGTKEKISEFIERLKEQHIKAVPLQVSHAFHSKAMDIVLAPFQQSIATITFNTPKLPIASNIDGKIYTTPTFDALYLTQQMRYPVHYLQAIQTIEQELHPYTYIECGPNPVLSALAKNILQPNSRKYLYTAKKDEAAINQFYNVLQQLYVDGFTINWQPLYSNKKINRVVLPNYTWQQQSFWYDVNKNKHQPIQNELTNAKTTIVTNKTTLSATKTVRKEELLLLMQLEAAKILGLDAGQQLDTNKPYREQGFDSMMSGEFLAKLENLIQKGEIKMDVIHNYPTPKELHQYLIDTYFGGGTIDTSQAISMADLMFNNNIDGMSSEDWHTINENDGVLMRWFKKIDKKLPKV